VRGAGGRGCYNAPTFLPHPFPMTATTRTTLLVLWLLFLGGCASLPPGSKRDPRDPWERMNRTTYNFNDKFDRAILRPVASGYRRFTPRFVQAGIGNFFDNLDYPIVIVNDLLQGEFRPFFSDCTRLILNSTIGIGGLWDPATRAGLEKNDREFGQTLGKWGVHKGPYVVLPFLGASDVRDAFGRLADDFSTPRQYIHNSYWNYGLFLVQEVDFRSRLLDTDHLVYEAYDPYAFLRNAYLQRRDFKVYGGQSPSEEEQERKLLEEAGQDDSSPPAQPSSQPH
jgi:phospholipid-binding lipoprotein MlaA